MDSKSYQDTKRLAEIPFLIQILTFFRAASAHCLMGCENQLNNKIICRNILGNPQLKKAHLSAANLFAIW